MNATTGNNYPNEKRLWEAIRTAANGRILFSGSKLMIGTEELLNDLDIDFVG